MFYWRFPKYPHSLHRESALARKGYRKLGLRTMCIFHFLGFFPMWCRWSTHTFYKHNDNDRQEDEEEKQIPFQFEYEIEQSMFLWDVTPFCLTNDNHMCDDTIWRDNAMWIKYLIIIIITNGNTVHSRWNSRYNIVTGRFQGNGYLYVCTTRDCMT